MKSRRRKPQLRGVSMGSMLARRKTKRADDRRDARKERRAEG